MKYINTITLTKVLFLIIHFLYSSLLGAQIPSGNGQTQYGNEWIDYDKTYLRIPIGQDGLYTIGYDHLIQAGWEPGKIIGNHLVLFHEGKQVPIQISTEDVFTETDQVVFYGEKNRTSLESFIFHDPERQMLNPEYSLFSDTAVYFLTLDSEMVKNRFENRMPGSAETIELVWTSNLTVYSGQYYTQAPQGLIDPDFNDLEGFATGFANSLSREIDVSQFNIQGDSILLRIGVGADLNTRKFTLTVNGHLIGEYENTQVQSARVITHNLPVSTLGNSIEIQVQGIENNNRVALAFVEMKYQISTKDLSRDSHSTFFGVHGSPAFSLNFPVDGHAASVYNIRQSTVFVPDVSDGIATYRLEGNASDIFVVGRNLMEVPRVQPIQFVNYLDQEMEYLIITSDYFLSRDSDQDQVGEYADYRRSEPGGSYKVTVATYEQLRDQFIYGIEGHPYAIRNFVAKLIDGGSPLRYVNVIGKGMGYGFLRSASDHNSYHRKSHFVPTFGHYGSDNLLVSEKGQTVPRVPIGRIPVTNPDEIGHYLEKVKTYESIQQNPGQIENREWMKRVMHFNGGDRNIFSTISNFMDNLGGEMQKDTFAAQLISYYKSSFGGTEIPERDEIFGYINEGAALISFFGHSASSSLDFNIDIIEEYDNQGRLPVFLALGCSSGNIFLPGKNLAEKFILTPDIGSILFLSTATSQYLSNLQNLARQFYAEFGSDQYGESLGQIVQQALAGMGRFQKHIQSVFVFAGDPAVSAYHFEGPDFTFDGASLATEPVRPSLVDETFMLEVDLQNLGRLNRDTFAVVVRHQLPGGEIRMMDTVWTNVEGFDRRLQLKLPITDDMEGKNTYFLTLDADNRIEEFPVGVGEANNELELNGKMGFDVFIQNTTLQLVYPYDMAIVEEEEVVLEIFNGNVDRGTRQYIVEVDTTPGFDSPHVRTLSVSSNQSRIRLPMEMNIQPEVVYYWRARWAQDSVYTRFHSFTHIPGKTGWNQSHFGQFQRDSLIDVLVDHEKLDFAELQNVYKLDHGHKKAAIIFNEIHRPRFFRTTNPALNVSIFKPRENTWVRNPKPGLYNSIWPVASDDYLFTFVYRPYSAVHRQAIVELIETEAQEGDYIFFWNTTNGRNSPEGETWALDSIDNQGVNLFNFFEASGATQIRALEEVDRRAYSLIYQKGGEVVTEILGDSAGVNIEYVNIPSYTDRGSIWSDGVTLLQSLEGWESGSQLMGSDSVVMKLNVGQMSETIRFHAGSPQSMSGSLDETEPIEFFWTADVFDLKDRTFPHFYWRVFGPFKPDWRINNLADVPMVDTAALQKNTLAVNFSIEGIGINSVDSVPVAIELYNGNRSFERRIKVGADQFAQNLHFTWPIEAEFNGSATLKITVDPENDWAEAHENNNAIFWNFDVIGDRIAPALTVLFDQQSILNGDIVAPNALITLELTDFPHQNISESPPEYSFEIKKPSGTVIKIDAANPALSMEVKEQGLELRYQSDFDENGMYELRANVRDAAGNMQKVDYVIDFEVVLENSVSAILPYPNPFVDAVRFAYTLTGTEEPEIFRIRIYTVSGRLVKEITKAEFGPMRIGRHLSEYVWDGRDNWNQDLAPGVYLYQVISRDKEGVDYEKYQINELEEGNYFRNGIGKMVKLR